MKTGVRNCGCSTARGNRCDDGDRVDDGTAALVRTQVASDSFNGQWNGFYCVVSGRAGSFRLFFVHLNRSHRLLDRRVLLRAEVHMAVVHREELILRAHAGQSGLLLEEANLTLVRARAYPQKAAFNHSEQNEIEEQGVT